MGHQLTITKSERMMKKAKDYLEGLKPEEFNNVEELVAYVYYLHILTADYLETVAEIIEANEHKVTH